MFSKISRFADGVDLSTIGITKPSEIATYLSLNLFKAKGMIIISDTEGITKPRERKPMISFAVCFTTALAAGHWSRVTGHGSLQTL